MIARLDKLSRNEDVQQKLQVPDCRWDLVVCDEAHKMSATFFGGEVKYTKRYRLGQLLSTLTRHFLLMTATPHNGKEEDFQLFMALLDGDRFEGRFRDGVHVADVSDLMRRMVKENLLTFDGTPLFPERIAHTVPYKLSEAEARLYKAVTDYVREEFNRAEALENDKPCRHCRIRAHRPPAAGSRHRPKRSTSHCVGGVSGWRVDCASWKSCNVLWTHSRWAYVAAARTPSGENLQALLTESAKLANTCLLVISLPASDTAGSPHTQADDVEVGGHRGREALDRLRNVPGYRSLRVAQGVPFHVATGSFFILPLPGTGSAARLREPDGRGTWAGQVLRDDLVEKCFSEPDRAVPQRGLVRLITQLSAWYHLVLAGDAVDAPGVRGSQGCPSDRCYPSNRHWVEAFSPS